MLVLSVLLYSKFYMYLLILLCVLSAGGIIALFGARFYSIRALKTEELFQGIVESKPFFSDFDNVLRLIVRLLKKVSIFLTPHVRKLLPYIKSLVKQIRGLSCRFSNYVHGRHLLKRNGCKGYWRKLNEHKNGIKKDDKPG